MGSTFSKRKHKGKWMDKETWTEEETDKKVIADVMTVDVGNQCVLQWIQKITSDGKHKKLIICLLPRSINWNINSVQLFISILY